MKTLAKILSQGKVILQKINDWIKLKTSMFGGFPLFLKLWQMCTYIIKNKKLVQKIHHLIRNCGIHPELTLKCFWILGNTQKDGVWISLHSTKCILGYRIHIRIGFLGY